MTKKPISLATVMAKKPTAEPEPAKAGGEGVKILTLRLPPVVHDQLREMAFLARRSQHAMVMEALNDFFTKHGKPPIAPVHS